MSVTPLPGREGVGQSAARWPKKSPRAPSPGLPPPGLATVTHSGTRQRIKVRPIQMGELLRKCIGKRLLKANERDINRVMLSARQFGCGLPGGESGNNMARVVNVLLGRLESTLHAQSTPVATRRYCKPTFARPAPRVLYDEIAAECSCAVVALAD